MQPDATTSLQLAALATSAIEASGQLYRKLEQNLTTSAEEIRLDAGHVCDYARPAVTVVVPAWRQGGGSGCLDARVYDYDACCPRTCLTQPRSVSTRARERGGHNWIRTSSVLAAVKVTELHQQATANKLRPEQWTDDTFTICCAATDNH